MEVRHHELALALVPVAVEEQERAVADVRGERVQPLLEILGLEREDLLHEDWIARDEARPSG